MTIATTLRAAIDDIMGADDPAQDAIRAIADALEAQAEATLAAEPYALRSAAEMKQAAVRVRALIDLMDEEETIIDAINADLLAVYRKECGQ